MVPLDTTQLRLFCLEHSPDAYMSLFSRISCSSILSMKDQPPDDAASHTRNTVNFRDPEVVKSMEPLFDVERFIPEMERSYPPLLEIGDDEIPFYHSTTESMIDSRKFYFDSSFCDTPVDSTPSTQDSIDSIASFVTEHRSSHESLFVDNLPTSIATDLPSGL